MPNTVSFNYKSSIKKIKKVIKDPIKIIIALFRTYNVIQIICLSLKSIFVFSKLFVVAS